MKQRYRVAQTLVFRAAVLLLAIASPLHSTTRSSVSGLEDAAPAGVTKLRVGIMSDRYPTMAVVDGDPVGLVVDYTRILAEVLDLEIEWRPSSDWIDLQNQLSNGEIDVLPYIYASDDRRSTMLFTRPVFKIFPGIAFFPDPSLRGGISGLQGATVGLPQVYYTGGQYLQNFSGVTAVQTPDADEAVQLLESGEIDVYLESYVALVESMEPYEEEGIRVQLLNRTFSGILSEMSIAVRSDWQWLVSAIERAAEWVYADELNAIVDLYLSDAPEQVQNEYFAFRSLLSSSEVAWLGENRDVPVRVFYLDGLAPISDFDDEGMPTGIVSSYLDELTRMFGITFEISGLGQGLGDGVRMIGAGEVDMIAALSETADRRELMSFTPPYLDLPIMVFGDDQRPFIGDFESVLTDPIVVTDGHAIQEWMGRDYPSADLIPAESVLSGLRRVEGDPNEVLLASAYSTIRMMIDNRVHDIGIIGTTPYSYQLSMGTRRGADQLSGIVRVGVDRIVRESGASIASYWLNAEVEPPRDTFFVRVIAIILIGSAVLLAFVAYTFTYRQRLLRQHAITDPLTGLNNRRFLTEIYDREVMRLKRDKRMLLYLLFDIDRFKQYNDRYGHRAGDKALSDVANLAKECFKRAGDFVFRIGGEEFCVFAGVASEEAAQSVLERFHSRFANVRIPHADNDDVGYLTVSMGAVIMTPESVTTMDEMYERADALLYEAKGSGRNTFRTEVIDGALVAEPVPQK